MEGHFEVEAVSDDDVSGTTEPSWMILNLYESFSAVFVASIVVHAWDIT